MHQIFLIPELLLHIVSFLSVDDLTHCLHTSHHWAHTLKNNLLPFNRPLPDSASERKLPNLQHLPPHICSLAAQIQTQDNQWARLPNIVDIGNNYRFWREGARQKLLEALAPHLHFVFSKSAGKIVAGLDELARGIVHMRIRTKMKVGQFRQLEEEEEEIGRAVYLMQPPVKVVEVSCIKGAEWDKSFTNVRQRKRGRKFRVRVEREQGVRMGDVIDELRGVLMEGENDNDDRDVLLEWRMG